MKDDIYKKRAGEAFCVVWLSLVLAAILFSGCKAQNASVRTVSKEEGEGTAQKVAYLTFDDGPSVLTERYLAILKEENVHATFFLIGQQMEGDLIAVVRRELSDGHEIGIHTYCHDADQIYCSSESYCEDLEKTRARLVELFDIEPRLFRFPWGSANSYIAYCKESIVEQMREEGLEYEDWNVSGEDSVGAPTADSILENVQKDYIKYENPVILLHDSASCEATLEALPSVIRELKEAGYSFATLSERSQPCHFGE